MTNTHSDTGSISWTYVNPMKGRLFPENSFFALKPSADGVFGSGLNSSKLEVSSSPFTTGIKGGTARTQERSN